MHCYTNEKHFIIGMIVGVIVFPTPLNCFSIRARRVVREHVGACFVVGNRCRDAVLKISCNKYVYRKFSISEAVKRCFVEHTLFMSCVWQRFWGGGVETEQGELKTNRFVRNRRENRVHGLESYISEY